MDTTATVTDIDPATGDATVKTDAPGTQGTESVATDNENKAGGSQDSTEGGGQDGQDNRRRGPTKLDTIRELRQKLRERDQSFGSEVQTLKSQIEELKGMISTGRQGTKPSKTFFEAPEETTRAILQEQLQTLKEELRQDMQQSRERDQQSSEWRQETSEATKFIETQKGLTPEDQDDIAEIVRSTPEMQNMTPMQRAKYALFIWKEERGIRDTSVARARAGTIQGTGTASGGKKEWTKSEIEAKINEFPIDPARWTPKQTEEYNALETEWKLAFKEGRVK